MSQSLPLVLEYGIRCIHFMQSFQSPSLNASFKALSFMGDERFFMAALPILMTMIGWRSMCKLGMIVATAAFFNEVLKLSLHLPRPFSWVPGLNLVPAEGFALPSGHAVLATVFWGYLAREFRHRPLFPKIAYSLAFLVGLSRIYLGVHFPTDVLAGFGVGALYLWGMSQHESLFATIWRTLATRARLMLLLLPSCLAIVLSESLMLTLGAVILGMGLGMRSGEPRLFPILGRLRLLPRTSKVLAASSSLAFIFGVHALLGLLLPHDASTVATFGKWLRYAILGLNLSFSGPWLVQWQLQQKRRLLRPLPKS